MQIVPVISLLKSQAAIISLNTLYCESIIKMKSPVDLWLLVEGTATRRFIRSCVSLYSDYFSHIFVETRDGKGCTSPVVFDTKNMEITNLKTWPIVQVPGPKSSLF